MQDREYSDISGFDFYVSSTALQYAMNVSVYLSPTPAFLNGSACVTNYSMVSTGATPNTLACANPIANARYVTVVRPVYTGAEQLHIYELQILRSGEAVPVAQRAAWML